MIEGSGFRGLDRPAPTLVPCWSLNTCLQGTSVGVGLPQPVSGGVCVFGHDRVFFKLGISSKTQVTAQSSVLLNSCWKLMRYWEKVIEDGLPFSSSLFWIFVFFLC